MMSSGGDSDRHRENLGVSQTKQAKKKKKSRRPIDPEDITESISSAPERISYDTHLFVVPFGRWILGNIILITAIRRASPLLANTPSPTGTSPQLSAMRLGGSSSEQ
ncbi:hypothetical protein RDI58_005852 [Solanum bulbocastanum]|uniref:Uncharacterized protein n=1 Tax=Solanum bulbocastanum TaxID=147425 RepID=A0AAN8U0R6_SOLBU